MDAATFRSGAAHFNRTIMTPLLGTGIGKKALGGSFAVLEYTGRKSGKQVTLPVTYTRRGEEVRVWVAKPDAKTWWRNFTGDGAPLTITMGDEVRQGHAVAHRGSDGKVSVTIALT